MTRSRVSLAVLSRVPELGKVKTRLQSSFSPGQTLALYAAMLRDTLEMVSSLLGQFSRTAVYWSGESGGVPADWAREFPSLDHRRQEGRDLGEKLYVALSSTGAGEPAIAIGCDSPTLPPKFLLRAAGWLGAQGTRDNEGGPGRRWAAAQGTLGASNGLNCECPDVVVGPAADGGYYLIGIRSAGARLFEGVHWGSCDVLPQSLRRAEEAGLTCRLLPEWYDLDSPADLARAMIARDPEEWPARYLRMCISADPTINVIVEKYLLKHRLNKDNQGESSSWTFQ